MPNFQSSRTSVITCFLVVYSLCHALVDASCAFLLLGAVDVRSGLLSYIILYNALALFIGAVPTYTAYKGWFQADGVIFIFILCALLFFYFGLRTLLRQKKA